MDSIVISSFTPFLQIGLSIIPEFLASILSLFIRESNVSVRFLIHQFHSIDSNFERGFHTSTFIDIQT